MPKAKAEQRSTALSSVYVTSGSRGEVVLLLDSGGSSTRAAISVNQAKMLAARLTEVIGVLKKTNDEPTNRVSKPAIKGDKR